MHIVYGTIKSALVGDQDILDQIARLYTFQVEGSYFSSAYKRGYWDGKKHFVNNKTGEFFSGLLPRIEKTLNLLNIKYEIKDVRAPSSDISSEFELPGVEFRDYQLELINKALDAGRCIIKSPTGSGKTIILAAIIKAHKNQPILILVNSKSILHQTRKYLIAHGIECGMYCGEGHIHERIMICTVQSYNSFYQLYEKAAVLIVDEIHEFCKGKVTLKAINSFPLASYRYAFTATPPPDKVSLLNIEGAFGAVITSKDSADLINQGYLARPTINMIPCSTTQDWLIHNTFKWTYPEIYEYCITNNVTRNEYIRDLVKSLPKGSKVLILTKALDHAKELNKLIPSYKLEGKDSILDREDVKQKFVESSDKEVIIGTRIFQTGVDIPEITHFINARGLKSEIATIQALGRALRIHESKTDVQIYDFFDNAKYLCNHSKERLAAYKDQGHVVITSKEIYF